MKIIGWTRYRQMTALIHDICLIPFAWLLAYWLRFNLEPIPYDNFHVALRSLTPMLCIQTFAFWHFGLYRGVWRFASVPDLARIIKAVASGVGLALAFFFLTTRLQGIPRSVFPLYGILLVMGLGGSRFFYRWLKDAHGFNMKGERVLVVGAGKAGESLVRDLLRGESQTYIPVAFVDDNHLKVGRDIIGIRIVGTTEQIPKLVQTYAIDTIIIALPSANAAQMRRLMSLCESTKKRVQTLPALGDVVAGRVSLKQLREVKLEDLLGRDPVSIDWTSIGQFINQKCVLVSGGAGSIGSELCRQIIKYSPKRLVVVDNSEYGLFQLEKELHDICRDRQVSFVGCLTDVYDRVGLEKVFQRHRPEVVFHAAAYKHVPILEFQVREAIRNNVLGTHSIARLSIEHGVEKFVLVSSDKAVNPSNVMGATKRVAEKLCQYLDAQSMTQFITVRFGNVLGSRGSVVETFREQLAAGGPLTVTHPDVTRYFMTIPEASQLILQSASMGRGGEIFMLDMGETVKIRYLAEQMIRLAGKSPEDIAIKYTGLRPGEKMTEELFHEEEALSATTHAKILKARLALTDQGFERWMARLETACQRGDDQQLMALLLQLVPEFQQKFFPKRVPESIL